MSDIVIVQIYLCRIWLQLNDLKYIQYDNSESDNVSVFSGLFNNKQILVIIFLSTSLEVLLVLIPMDLFNSSKGFIAYLKNLMLFVHCTLSSYLND